MLDKMIGVSPPQAGEARESKVTDLKDFQGSADKKTQFKLDFERALKEKSWQQKKDLEKKNELARREDLKAEKQKKSSGGTKKKMTEVDDKMVSNSMASKESVVETPVSKIEETAQIKVNSSEQGQKSQIAVAALLAQLATGEVADQSLLQKPEEFDMQLPNPEIALSEESQQALQANLKAEPKVTSHLNAVEQELGASVQYEAAAIHPPKMDSQAQTENQLQAQLQETQNGDQFEKNVLLQLRQENSFSNETSAGSQEQGSDKSDKKEMGSTNELHQSVGQSHTSFKSHVESSQQSKPALDVAGRLEAHREANINEIMNQAQYLVKKGGGEMTVKMSPDGLGEVQLRVQLLNGKLNVEMQTQDREVKKLIEESLSDLKSGLAAHRLSLEHVKVDTVNATNTDNSTQLQSNLNQGRHEGQAQDTWNSVQQQMQNNSSNQSGQRQTNQRDQVLSLDPVSLPQVSQAKGLRTYGGTKGATINRVA